MSERFGEMRQWTGGEAWVTVQGVTQCKNQLLLKTGDLFWLPSDGGVEIDTIISHFVDDELHLSSKALQWVSRDQYRHAVREKRLAECPANVQTITTENISAPAHLAPLLKMGVKFF